MVNHQANPHELENFDWRTSVNATIGDLESPIAPQLGGEAAIIQRKASRFVTCSCTQGQQLNAVKPIPAPL